MNIATLARWRHPIAVVRAAEIEAGRIEAQFQLAVIDAIDLTDEPEAERARLAEWRRVLIARAGRQDERG